jgi:1-deoxy-D-xylulose-5-phosphate reductoisomerase
MMPKRLAVLGSTGSVGVSTLKIVRDFPDRLVVVALAAGRPGSWPSRSVVSAAR